MGEDWGVPFMESGKLILKSSYLQTRNREVCGVRCPLKKNTEDDEQNEGEEVAVRSSVAAAKRIIEAAAGEPQLGRASTLKK